MLDFNDKNRRYQLLKALLDDLCDDLIEERLTDSRLRTFTYLFNVLREHRRLSLRR